MLGGGSLTNEKAYLLGKFARVGLGTANVDYNGRFCMSSAAAASERAFGIDRGLPFPLADIGNLRRIEWVVANGRIHSRRDLEGKLDELAQNFEGGRRFDDASTPRRSR